MPPDFDAALDADPQARQAFDAMSHSHKLRWVLSIDDAKSEQTRGRRIAEAVETLREGASLTARAVSPPPRPEPAIAVLVVAGAIGEGDAALLCERLAAIARGSDAEVIVCDVRALAADARSIDVLARLQLTARRLGRRICLHRPSAELHALLSFLGLADVVGGGGPARRDLLGRCLRQAEQRKQPRRVEERVDRDDAPA